MASIVQPGHGAEHEHSPVHHQFEDFEQQTEAYIIGMWSFLAQEIMFFGGLFLIYTLYRSRYQETWYQAHTALNVVMGGTNTMVLLFSSFTMVLAVHAAQLKDKRKVLMYLGATIGCAFVFLIIKFFEYKEKFEHMLVPGPYFSVEHFMSDPATRGINPNAAQIFFSLYFAMTGLHALHIIIGILVLGALARHWMKDDKLVTHDYVPTELVGLYWHFVDVVWIFLFPLFYLIPK
jgi:cytochrome c oxidase subunit 3